MRAFLGVPNLLFLLVGCELSFEYKIPQHLLAVLGPLAMHIWMRQSDWHGSMHSQFFTILKIGSSNFDECTARFRVAIVRR